MPTTQSIKNTIKSFLRSQGAEIKRFPSGELLRRITAMRHFGVDCVLDIGANAGQFAGELLEVGYRGRIISFEPLSQAYARLQAAAAKHPNWETRHAAIGDRNGEVDLHIAGNSFSSSLLPMLQTHLDAAPESAYTGRETTAIHRLEDLWEALDLGQHRCIYLKSDTQGFDYRVLQGAGKRLQQLGFVQVEMNLVHLYEGDQLYPEITAFLEAQGFTVFSLDPEFADPHTGRLVQLNGTFIHTNLLSAEPS